MPKCNLLLFGGLFGLEASLRHMTLKDYVSYLQEYAAHFAVMELIRYKVKAGAQKDSEERSSFNAI